MTSADPTVTDPMNPQGWNRYSYVGNDPLAFTDPNGFSWLSSFFHSVSHAISGAVHAVTHFFQTNAIARSILQIGATIVLSTILGPGGVLASIGLTGAGVAAVAGAGGAMIAAGLSGGNLSQVLKAGVIAGATALAFYGVGELTTHGMPSFDSPNFNPSVYAQNVAGHAGGWLPIVGSFWRRMRLGRAGRCGRRRRGTIHGRHEWRLRLVASAVLGGIGSVAGGGKFANGAITGAFGYLFNELGANAIRKLYGLRNSIFANELRGHHKFPQALAIEYDELMSPTRSMRRLRIG